MGKQSTEDETGIVPVYRDRQASDLLSRLAALPEMAVRLSPEARLAQALYAVWALLPATWGAFVAVVLHEIGDDYDALNTWWHQVRRMRWHRAACWWNALELCVHPDRDMWPREYETLAAFERDYPDLANWRDGSWFDCGTDWRDELRRHHQEPEPKLLRRERRRIDELHRLLVQCFEQRRAAC